ncbi:MAG TPA: elongation factor G [Rhodanobacteraceae bacterium]
MSAYTTADIRNVALAGHAGAGKTTLFEALLHAAGAIGAAGSVERGNTVSDFDPQERARGHSIFPAIAALDSGGCHVNLIDTAGYADFRGGTLSTLAAADTCAVVVNAGTGVEHGTRRLMHYARERRLARMLIVNRIDADDADPAAVLVALRAEFGPECLPVNLPADHGARVADCFFTRTGTSDLGPVADAHQRIIDQVVEINERLMGRYLDAGEAELAPDAIHAAFEQCLRAGHLVPVCFTSARTGAGVAEWLDIARRLLPHPGEANPPPFVRGSGADAVPLTAKPDPAAHVIADVFRIINDPFVGKLALFRVWQGSVRKDSQLFIDDGRKAFKVGHLIRVQGKDHIPVDTAIPGDLAGIAKVDDIHFDAILHDAPDAADIHLQPLAYPRSMFGLALEPTHAGQDQKLAAALEKLAEEDPCLKVERNRELNETVLHGLSDLHLKLALARMHDKYGVEVTAHRPRIAYRETIGAAAEGHHRHKKQTGGAGQFGEVFLRVEPLPRGGGFEFRDASKGGVIPNQFIPAIEKGVRQALARGAIAGYPLQDVRVTVYDGKYHPVDSKEVAFVVAGRKAFLDAVTKAGPLVLEPVVTLEVNVPERYVGDVTGALAGKRARIHGTSALRRGTLAIQADAPLAEIIDYQTELRALTGGEGRFGMEFSHYAPVPAQVQKQLVAAYRPAADDD